MAVAGRGASGDLAALRCHLGSGYRYHPAIIAQGAATLAEMFPGRFWLALGSGQRLNEDVTGFPWPEKAERNARLFECANIIRSLLAGHTVLHHGRVTVIEARLYSLPHERPFLLGAAVTEATAELVGRWADGLLTVNAKPQQVCKVVEAFRRGGGAGKPLLMQVGLNWAPTEQQAAEGAHQQWKYNALGGEVNWELRSPGEFETAAKFVRIEDMRESVLISADPARHAAWLQEYIELGFEELLLHQVGLNQREFIDVFGCKVLPQLRQ
jgi:coenzyme F420-dependent glucose-6-phosphate dehydrogenase